MESAIITILFLFFLVVPTFIFRRIFYAGRWVGKYFKHSWFVLFTGSIIPGILIHISFIIITLKFNNYLINYKEILEIIELNNIYSINADEAESLAHSFLHYNLFLWIYTFLIGLLSKIIIRKFRIDRKIPIFRFPNRWHYLFSGEYLDFANIPGVKSQRSFTWLNILVSSGGENIIYSGYYSGYSLKDNSTELNTITLQHAHRKILHNPNHQEKKQNWKKISDLFLTLDTESVKSIGISYWRYHSIPKHLANLQPPGNPLPPKIG